MTIRIFVGCAANHEDAESQAVLEYSIRKHASEPVEITWMKLSRDPESPFYSGPDGGWDTSRWATPFSGFRWALPWLCNFEGEAIYMDSDFIVMADIAELWHQEFKPGKAVMAKGALASWRMCCSKWNCSALSPGQVSYDRIRSDPNLHHAMTRHFLDNPQYVQHFEGHWNCLDGESFERLDEPPIKAIHYTAMMYQPHLVHAIPRLAEQDRKHWFDGVPSRHWRDDLIELFDDLLMEAEDAGYTVESYCQDPLFGEYTKRSVAGAKPPAHANGYRVPITCSQ